MNGYSISHWGVFLEPDNNFYTNAMVFLQDGHIEKVDDSAPMRWSSRTVPWPKGLPFGGDGKMCKIIEWAP